MLMCNFMKKVFDVSGPPSYIRQNKKRNAAIYHFFIKLIRINKFHLYHFKDMLFGHALHIAKTVLQKLATNQVGANVKVI